MEGFFFFTLFIYFHAVMTAKRMARLLFCGSLRTPEIPLRSECCDKISAALLLIFHTANFFFFFKFEAVEPETLPHIFLYYPQSNTTANNCTVVVAANAAN